MELHTCCKRADLEDKPDEYHNVKQLDPGLLAGNRNQYFDILIETLTTSVAIKNQR